MVVLDAVRPVSTFASAVEIVEPTSSRTQLTSSRTGQKRHSKDGKYPAWFPSRSPRQTGLLVDPAEQGNEDERNEASTAQTDKGWESEAQKVVENGAFSRVRSELARDLVQRVAQLEPLIGEVALATQINLLKRDLSHCHDVLKGHPGESDFLSIVTLVESAMTPLKWKQYTRPTVAAIRDALNIGYRQVRVGFEDYQMARSLLSNGHVDATPRLDLGAVNWNEIEDDEEA